MAERITSTKSSGNIFKDMGYADVEAEAMLAKAELASKINEIIGKRKLTQKEVAKVLGILQPNVSLLRRGILSDFSLERLMRFLAKLHQNIEIVIHEKPFRKNGLIGHISVACAQY